MVRDVCGARWSLNYKFLLYGIVTSATQLTTKVLFTLGLDKQRPNVSPGSKE